MSVHNFPREELMARFFSYLFLNEAIGKPQDFRLLEELFWIIRGFEEPLALREFVSSRLKNSNDYRVVAQCMLMLAITLKHQIHDFDWLGLFMVASEERVSDQFALGTILGCFLSTEAIFKLQKEYRSFKSKSVCRFASKSVPEVIAYNIRYAHNRMNKHTKAFVSELERAMKYSVLFQSSKRRLSPNFGFILTITEGLEKISFVSSALGRDGSFLRMFSDSFFNRVSSNISRSGRMAMLREHARTAKRNSGDKIFTTAYGLT